MNIEYIGRNLHVNDQLREFSEQKLAKISKFLEEPIDIRLTFEVEKHSHVADLHVNHRLGVLQAREETEDLKGAIHLAVDKVEKQARRARKKLVDRRRRGGSVGPGAWPVDVLDAGTVDDVDGPEIVRSSTLKIESMGLSDAARSLQSSSNDFVVFRDAVRGDVNVLYKRRDGNYGLISPEG